MSAIWPHPDAPAIETERLLLRVPHVQDVEGIVAYFTSDRSRYTGGPLAPEKAWRVAAAEIGHWAIRGWGMFSVCEKSAPERALGIVGPWYPAGWPEREVGWLLWPEAEGRGIAFEAARASLDYAFNTLGWETAVSYIDKDNARSVALAEKLGARLDPSARTPEDEDMFVYRHHPATEKAA